MGMYKENEYVFFCLKVLTIIVSSVREQTAIACFLVCALRTRHFGSITDKHTQPEPNQ